MPGDPATARRDAPAVVRSAGTVERERRPPPQARTGRPVCEETGRVVVVRSRGTELTFHPAELRATAGERLTIRYENVNDMIHNLVLVRSGADVPIVGEAAFAAAFTNQWVPTGEDDARRMIAYTGLAGPHEVVETTFTVPPVGEYPFICTYASHWTLMRGR